MLISYLPGIRTSTATHSQRRPRHSRRSVPEEYTRHRIGAAIDILVPRRKDMTGKRFNILALFVVFSLLLAACGGETPTATPQAPAANPTDTPAAAAETPTTATAETPTTMA